MGGAVFVAAGQCVFNNRLLQGVMNSSSGLDAATVLATGASELRKVFSGSALDTVLDSYLGALKACFILGTAGSATAVFLAFVAPLRSIKSGSLTSSVSH